jgi:hypothetical protein
MYTRAQTLQTAVSYLRSAYPEEPQDVQGIVKRLDLIETRFGFWYTTGGLECMACWRARKPSVVYSNADAAEKHSSGHESLAA